jgi:uncharacterized membrane protein YfhO
VEIDAAGGDQVVVRETWDPGWQAILDGKPVCTQPKWGVFLGVAVPAGRHELILKYEPTEFQFGLAVSSSALVILFLVLTRIRLFWIPGITTRGGLDGHEPRS